MFYNDRQRRAAFWNMKNKQSVFNMFSFKSELQVEDEDDDNDDDGVKDMMNGYACEYCGEEFASYSKAVSHASKCKDDDWMNSDEKDDSFEDDDDKKDIFKRLFK